MSTSSANQTPRQGLLQAAAKLFREKGYERTTVRDLAKAVGLQSGSLFYHFKNKEEILQEVMRDGILAAAQAADDKVSADMNARQQLHALVIAHLETLLGSSEDALAVMLYEWRSLPEQAQLELIQLRDDYEMRWQKALMQAKAEGLITGNLSVKRRYLLGALNWTGNWFKEGGSMGIEQLAAEMTDMICGTNSSI